MEELSILIASTGLANFTAGQVVASTDLLTVLPRHFLRATGMKHRLAQTALPLTVPAVHVDAIWHRQFAHDSARRWLLDAVSRASAAGFRGEARR